MQGSKRNHHWARWSVYARQSGRGVRLLAVPEHLDTPGRESSSVPRPCLSREHPRRLVRMPAALSGKPVLCREQLDGCFI